MSDGPRNGFHHGPHGSPVQPALEVRYIIFSTKKGIFLGDGKWSYLRDEGPLPATAPTFSEAEVKDQVIALKSRDADLGSTSSKQVWPDQDDKHASVKACTDACLPGWEPYPTSSR